MTDDKKNPFAPTEDKTAKRKAESHERPHHASDDPGVVYDNAGVLDQDEQTKSSGVSSPSQPRRPGTGGRHAPYYEEKAEVIRGSIPLVPGEILFGEGDVEINAGAQVTTLRVVNPADRPIQVGSHFHFAEVNAALEFDREAAWGKRLNVLSGGAVRFEPGAVMEVELIPIKGQRIVPGLRGLCGGSLDG